MIYPHKKDEERLFLFSDILHCVSQNITLCLPLNCFEIFCVVFSKYFTMVFNISSNVLHKSTYAGQSLSYCFLRALFRKAIVRRRLAALLAMPALASPSSCSSLITTLSRCTLWPWMSRCGRGCFISDNFLPLHPYTCTLCGQFARKLEVLCWHFSLDLPEEEMTSDR